LKKGVSFLLYIVKLSSLFKHKAYAFSQAGDGEDDCKFATAALKKIKPNLELAGISLARITDNYDIYSLRDEKEQFYKFKISLLGDDNILKREATALRSIAKNESFPSLVKQGVEHLGEDITYLLSKVKVGESVRDYGRSVLMHKIDEFLESYWTLPRSRPVRAKYSAILSDFLEQLIPSECLPETALESVKSYTNYDVCEQFLLELRSETLTIHNNIEGELNKKCHGNLSIDSIFYTNPSFYFDELHNVSMGHPYVDFVDLILETGVNEDNDIKLLKKFCDSGEIAVNRDLYFQVYLMQLRKKLADLLISYIREVYLYDSYRYEQILYIADNFSHLYERFCKIELFKNNRDFIMKTICEPIFGVKA